MIRRRATFRTCMAGLMMIDAFVVHVSRRRP